MIKDDSKRIVEEFKRINSAYVLSHVDAEGDNLGSSLAIYWALKKQGAEVDLVNSSGAPSYLSFLPGFEKVISKTPELARKYAVILDSSNFDRLGAHKHLAQKADISINLDHHTDNQCLATYNWVEETAATGVVVYHLLKKLQVPLDKNIATCLYTAIMTDTGNFQYGRVDAELFAIASELIATGINPIHIHDEVFNQKDFLEMKCLGEALDHLTYEKDIKLAWTWFREIKDEFSHMASEQLIRIKDVDLIIIFKQVSPQLVKISFRSKSEKVSSRLIAQALGGGGHIKMAATVLSLPIEQAIEKTLEVARNHLYDLTHTR